MKWHPIPGYEPYLLNDDHEVRHPHGLRSLTVKRMGRGRYLGVRLTLAEGPRNVGLHRLVAAVYVPNPDGKPEVNHRNGDPTDNRPDNLEWATHRENMDHASRIGLLAHGSRHHAAKLTPADVIEIRRRYDADEIASWNALAREYRVTWATIQKVILRRSWKHI
jgi:hypothetical protein